MDSADMGTRWWVGTLVTSLGGWVLGFAGTLLFLFSRPGATLDLAWSMGISDQTLNLILFGGGALGASACVGLLRGARAALAALLAAGAVTTLLYLASITTGSDLLLLGPSMVPVIGAATLAARPFPRSGPELRPGGGV
jgi:hypothetical protein